MGKCAQFALCKYVYRRACPRLFLLICPSTLDTVFTPAFSEQIFAIRKFLTFAQNKLTYLVSCVANIYATLTLSIHKILLKKIGFCCIM